MNNLVETIKLQHQASDPLNSAWVFASAGSGKTKILTDRVLRLLLRGVRAEKILCLTFTKTAAAEMQHRINNELAKWVILDDQELIHNIKNLGENLVSAEDLKKARILFARILDSSTQIKVQTIHSFCQNLVKIFPFEIGVRPNFEICDSNVEKLLLQKAKKEVIKDAFSDPILQKSIIEINSNFNDESFNELVSGILTQKERLLLLKENYFGIENLIDKIFTKLECNKNFDEQEIFSEFLNKIKIDDLLQMCANIELAKQKTNQKTAQILKKFLQNPKIENFSAFKEIFYTKEDMPKKMGSVVTKEFESYYDLIVLQQGLIADFYEKFNSYKIAKSTALLLRFIDHILEKYRELKDKNSLLDYNDLIVKIEKMLSNPEVADWVKFRMDGFFDHILVDESQDTNHRQWAIIKALTEDFFSGHGAQNRNRTIFIIGDDKQSIYSFQGAEPNISNEIFAYYQEKLGDGPFKMKKIDLQNSFRQLDEILKIIDKVFVDKNLLGINNYNPHKAIRNGSAKFEIWPQIKPKKDQEKVDYVWKINNSQQENYSEKEFLADLIALRIKGWVESNRVIAAKNRPINYGDIMILLRNRANGFDKILQKSLKKHQIAYGGAKKSSFSQELLIQDLLSSAKFVLLQEDDLNLACLLKSPLIAIDEEKLLEICLLKNQQNCSIFAIFEQNLPQNQQIYAKLGQFIENAKNLNCYDFFARILNQETRKKIINQFGLEGATILDQFMIILANFANKNSKNLQKFIDFVEKLDPEIYLTSPEQNQVNISTIHSSKGLQAPIIIIPDCAFDFNKTLSSKENFFWINFAQDHENIALPIWCARKKYENKLIKAHKLYKNQLAKQEYYRLLYVAMTRAEDELYLAGFGNAAHEESWYHIVRNSVESMCLKHDFIESLTDSEQKYFKKKIENLNIDDKIFSFGQQEASYLPQKFINNPKIIDEKLLNFLQK